MSDLVWSSLLAIAVLTFYLGWFERDPQRMIINYISSIVFWVATMIQWMLDNPQDPTITWIYILPISICVFQVFHAAVAYMGDGMGYKGDSYK